MAAGFSEIQQGVMECTEPLAVAQFCIHTAKEMQDYQRIVFVSASVRDLAKYQSAYRHVNMLWNICSKLMEEAWGRTEFEKIFIFILFFFKAARVINLFFIYSRIKYCSVTHACKFLLD